MAIACLALVALCRSRPGLQRAVGVLSVVALASGFGDLWIGVVDDQEEGLNVWSRIFVGLVGTLVMVGMDSAILMRVRGDSCLGRAEEETRQRKEERVKAADEGERMVAKASRGAQLHGGRN